MCFRDNDENCENFQFLKLKNYKTNLIATNIRFKG